MSEINIDVEDDDYPVEVCESLLETAQRRFEENKHHGGWDDDEARWHLYKAHDEISEAVYHSKHGEDELMGERLADAVNHLCFALDIGAEEI